MPSADLVRHGSLLSPGGVAHAALARQHHGFGRALLGQVMPAALVFRFGGAVAEYARSLAAGKEIS